MKLLIEIPDEFINDYSNNKFADFFERVKVDMNTLCGNYERETADMFIRAFAESRESHAVNTNADRIRSFSDEELAEFIEQVSTDSMDTISFGTKEYEEIWEHKENALQWLQSEVEE